MLNTDIKTIKTALKRLKPFTQSKAHLAIMNYIRIESQSGKLNLTVPTLEFGKAASFTTATVPTGQDSFNVCVKFQDFQKLINKCKSDVRFSRYGVYDLEIKSGSLTFKLNGKDSDEFPELPETRTDSTATTSVSYGDIKSELSFISTAICGQTPADYTSGVLFDYADNSRLRLIGTDGRRLHSTFTNSQVHSVPDDKPKYLVPVKWVDAFNRLKIPTDETAYLKFHGDDQLDWSIPTQGLSGTVSLIDSPYPEYEKVIPNDCTSRFRLNVQDTIETLDGLSVIACTQDGRDMVVVKANGSLNLSARSESMGNASGRVNCYHLEGKEIRFALNVGYFTETLKLADKRAVIMAGSGHLEPVRFDYLETDRVAVVMPVRLPE